MVDSKRVYVLGAGFTRAILPKAPLMEDDYGGRELLVKYDAFEPAKSLLSQELAIAGGNINIERLMTRLDAGMPYDDESEVQGQFRMLLKDLRDRFRIRLKEALGDPPPASLDRFAFHCVENGISRITFNYDDVLDKALWGTKCLTALAQDTLRVPYWHPDGGYGFFCRPSTYCVQESSCFMDVTSMLLLKLHGSVNWRIRRGSIKPYVIDSVLHHEDWLPNYRQPGDVIADKEVIELHLESEPFIVPPVLAKSSFVDQPILRTVWRRARRTLQTADEVVFIGYSIPVTDIASTYLFRESVKDGAKVVVVDKRYKKEEQDELVANYRKSFGGKPFVGDINYFFEGAIEWMERLFSEQPLPGVINLRHDPIRPSSRTHGAIDKVTGDLLRECADSDALPCAVNPGTELHVGDVPKPPRVRGDAKYAYMHRRDLGTGQWVVARQ